VLPEITEAGRLARLVQFEREIDIEPEGVRRLAALLPEDREVAASVGARLRLSKRLSKRLVSAADNRLGDPEALAYEIGAAEAVDRFLLQERKGIDLAALASWKRPRLPVSGGDLIAMGLEAGPIVAGTMQAIEREWVSSGFPTDRKEVRALARRHVDQALRASA
jgi:poly(A) polymerase